MRMRKNILGPVLLLLVVFSACELSVPPPAADDADEASAAIDNANDHPPCDDPPAEDDPPADDPPVLPIDISTDGCNSARWCGDLFGAQSVSNLDLVPCGTSCSIRQTQTDVEGCMISLTGAVGIALEGSDPDSYLSFGSVAVGESRAHVVRIENQGDADCPITSILVTAGSPFAFDDPAVAVLAPGAFVDVPIRFAPTAARGIESALFNVPGAATAWLTLSGTSVEVGDTSCVLQVAAQYADGIDVTATVDHGRTTSINIINAGGGGCLLLPLEVTGEAFHAAPALGPFDDPLATRDDRAFVAYPSTLPLDVTDGVLAPGEHVSLDVSFAAPAEPGTSSAMLVIRAQDAIDVELTLTGTATPAPPLCACEENWGSSCTINPNC
jgi:hypothetical protein